MNREKHLPLDIPPPYGSSCSSTDRFRIILQGHFHVRGIQSKFTPHKESTPLYNLLDKATVRLTSTINLKNMLPRINFSVQSLLNPENGDLFSQLPKLTVDIFQRVDGKES